MKQHTLLMGTIFFIFLTAGSAFALPPVVRDITVTDVTPVSFSVVWSSDQASSCNITVFSDENGTDDITADLVITPHPTRNNSAAVVTAAQNRGVMKIRVTGLVPSTTYYFKTATLSISGAETTFFPSAAPFASVTTSAAVSKTTGFGLDEIPFTNDLVYSDIYEGDGSTPAEGTLLLASVDGARYPVSSFAGDEFASPRAAVDLNNLYTSLDDGSFALHGGQKIVLTAFYGIDDKVTSVWVVPANHNSLTSRAPVGLADTILILQAMTLPDGGPDLSHIADINNDDHIGMAESIHIMETLAQVR
jgi:hypothetical protein